MNFSLVICTYQRKKALKKLLNTVKNQTVYPTEILIIDGSIDKETEILLKNYSIENLKYFHVTKNQRGLTKQRNFGIEHTNSLSEVLCFLDDDVILEPNYFEELLNTYKKFPKAVGIGGYITNEVIWNKATSVKCLKNEYCIDGYKRKEGLRFKIRKYLKLIDATLPGFMPLYSHGRSISYLPPSGNIYAVEYFMGGVSSFKTTVFEKIQFSTYFEGYGLYEDLDFCLRASKLGNLYVNTNAKLEHHHEQSGRPNSYKYGKMVVRNGWYVWKKKYKKTSFKATLLFHLNVILLLKIRFINSFYGNHKMEAFTEGIGRLVGWFSLFFNKPNIDS